MGEIELWCSCLVVVFVVGRIRIILEREGDVEEGDGEVGVCCFLYLLFREVLGLFVL